MGSLLFLEAVLMGACLVMATIYEEDDIPAFIASILVTTFIGFIFKHLGRNSENKLSRRDSFLLVTLVWVVFSLFATRLSSLEVTLTLLPMLILKLCRALQQQEPPSLMM